MSRWAVEAWLRAGIFPRSMAQFTVAELQNPASLDSVRDRLLDLIDGIDRGNRLANTTGRDHLDQLAQQWRDFGENVRVAFAEALDAQLIPDHRANIMRMPMKSSI